MLYNFLLIWFQYQKTQGQIYDGILNDNTIFTNQGKKTVCKYF